MSDLGLTGVLEKFNEDGKFASDDHWKINNGGYDLLWQLYYDERLICEAFTGNDVRFQSGNPEENRRIIEEIIKVFGKHTVNGHKVLPREKASNIVEFYAEELSDVRDSMEFDSGTEVACMKLKNGVEATITVHGEVSVYWCPSGDFATTSSGTFREPSSFPEELKEIIHKGYAMEYDFEENDIQSEVNWDCDKRVCVDNNNWFELYIRGNHDGEVVDVGGLSRKEIYEMLAEHIEYYEGAKLVPSYEVYEKYEKTKKEIEK